MSRMLGMKLSREHLNALTTAVAESASAALREGGNAAAAAHCRRLNGVLDAEIDALQAAGAGVACAPGCNFCCHLRVGVFRHEAAALLLELRTRIAPAAAALIEQRILANARRVDALTP